MVGLVPTFRVHVCMRRMASWNGVQSVIAPGWDRVCISITSTRMRHQPCGPLCLTWWKFGRQRLLSASDTTVPYHRSSNLYQVIGIDYSCDNLVINCASNPVILVEASYYARPSVSQQHWLPEGSRLQPSSAAYVTLVACTAS